MAYEILKSYGQQISVDLPRIGPDLFKRWTEFVDAKPKTLETYTRCIRQFNNFLQDNQISKPQRADILAYRDYLRQDKKPTTIQIYMTAVKLFFSWTAQENIYPNIAEHLKGARIDRGYKKDYLTSKQIKSILARIDRHNLKGFRNYAIIALMTTTGLRTIEVVRANIEDLRARGDSLVLYVQGKGHEEKTEYVKVADPVQEALQEYLTRRGPVRGSSALFASCSNHNRGQRMTTRSVSRLVKLSFLDAGLNSDRLTAHSLRHTAATLNLLNGATIEETQQLLRHSNINTTLIYSHALERANNNSESRIAKTIF